MTPKDILGLIATIYGGVADPGAMPSILRSMCDAVGARAGFVRAVDYGTRNVDMFQTVGYEEKFKAAYRDHFIKLDPYRRCIETSPPGLLISIAELPENQGRKSTEYYNEYERPQGFFHGIGGILTRAQPHVIYTSLLREESAGAFTPQELRRMEILFPHLCRSVQMQLLLAGTHRAVSLAYSALDRLSVGVLLLDGQARILYSNYVAECLLKQPGGPRIRGGRLEFLLPAEMVKFQKLVAAARETSIRAGVSAGGQFRSSSLLDPSKVIDLIISPLQQEQGLFESYAANTSVAVFLSRRGSLHLPLEPLAACFGLTPAEAKLAANLARGESIEDVAEAQGISIHTARTQLKSIFAKTGTRRQGELISRLMHSVLASVRPEGP